MKNIAILGVFWPDMNQITRSLKLLFVFMTQSQNQFQIVWFESFWHHSTSTQQKKPKTCSFYLINHTKAKRRRVQNNSKISFYPSLENFLVCLRHFLTLLYGLLTFFFLSHPLTFIRNFSTENFLLHLIRKPIIVHLSLDRSQWSKL